MSLARAISLAADRQEVPADVLEAAFGEIVSGSASPVRIAALLVALRTKGETAHELAAAARALRAHAETAALVDPRTVDTCGTGGDGANTFNISTIAAFVVAGAGVPVAKHGNRAATSQCGSFDLLEALGVQGDLPVPVASRILSELGIAPFFARRAHPAMRFVAPVRAELPHRTLMNAMGPLLSPVGARRQLIGVYARSLVETLAEVLRELGSERALVVHGDDGLDEITTTAATHAALLDAGRVQTLRIEPEALGIARARPEALRGGDAQENARIARAVLDGEPGAPLDIVLVNAGAALFVAGAAADLCAGVACARASVASGAAKAKLAALVAATQAARA
ncbi:MAG TPA: anthranilate phosphoribosyltransferase [Myxococcota bacterium]|jgi:anthranilate phosphoribosyltransferase